MQLMHTKKNERRAKHRFRIERELRYKLTTDGVVVASGSGQTLDLCSGGVAFTSAQALKPGAFVELRSVGRCFWTKPVRCAWSSSDGFCGAPV